VSNGGATELLNAFADAALPVNGSSLALESSRLIHSGACYMVAFTVANTAVAAQFVQFHDATSLPADGLVPAVVFTVAGSADKTVAYTLPGRLFREGIVVCNSSTAATKTIGAANCFFDVQYLPVD
jgi:hypothetical protein